MLKNIRFTPNLPMKFGILALYIYLNNISNISVVSYILKEVKLPYHALASGLHLCLPITNYK